ncbi:MAG TPA: transglutaminase domain-containing protein [Clostridia bacterium]|nr:transglutaminase domain-containing protein [Clostridia bacterium]
MTINKLTDKISDILLAMLVTFSIVYALISSLCLPYPVLNVLLLVVLSTVLFAAMFYNKTASIISFSGIGLVLLISMIYTLFGAGIDKVSEFFEDYYFWLSDFILYPDPVNVNAAFQLLTVIPLCIIVSLFSYCFILRKFRFFVVLIAGIAIFGVQWSYGIVSSLLPFYLFLIATLMIYLKHIYQGKLSKSPNDYASPSQIALWSLPVCILIIALAYTIHASDKPIEWKWMDKKIVSVYNYFKKNFDYETFDYFSLSATSGFGDRNNILGGRVRLDRTNVLQVSSGKRVYLKGIALDTYTGNKWINGDTSISSQGTDYYGMYGDTDEMLEGMKLLTGKDDFLNTYFEENPVSVIFLNIKTKSLFLPSKIKEFRTSTKDFSAYMDSTGGYSSKQRYTKGFKYNTKMYVPKVGSEEFSEIMRKSKKGLYSNAILQMKFPSYYEEILRYYSQNSTNGAISPDENGEISVESFFQKYDSQTLSGTAIALPVINRNSKLKTLETLSKLKDSSNEIYKRYLQLPKNLPQRVKDLSASLVATEKNDYDKAKAIEQYMASKYPYNLDVRSTPRNRDFVDYFLFDLKEGYCSYYASAMTVLARCAGLPARYVEGYMLPAEPVKNDNTTYVVSNMQAHAWVEIYFEGYGWLPFEPTAPFRSEFYANTEYSDVTYSSDYDPSYNAYMEELMKRYAQQGGGYVDFGPDGGKTGPSAEIIAIFTLAGLLILSIALLMTNIIRNRLRLYKIINLPATDCVLSFYDYYINVLGIQGLGLLPSETPFQYCSRIDSNMFFSPVRFKTITDIFVKSRYGTEQATENEKQLFCDFHAGFLSEIKINMGKLKYFTMKYLLGKF